jgi:molybdate transport system substrate-binding protein
MSGKWVIYVAMIFMTVSHSYAAERRIMAFCAAITKPAVEEAAEAFKKGTGISVDVSFGGSGAMLSQLKLARRGDVYIAASPDYIVKAERDRVIDPKSVRILAYLVPAINVQPGNPMGIRELSDLTKPGVKVGICNPETAAIGLMGIEILAKNSYLKSVLKNVITQAPNIGVLESLLVMKKVDAIIGWGVLQNAASSKVETVFLKPDQVPRLSYIPAAITSYAADRESAMRFLEYLASDEGKRIFTRYGYGVTEGQIRKYAPKAQIGGEYILPPNWSEK